MVHSRHSSSQRCPPLALVSRGLEQGLGSSQVLLLLIQPQGVLQRQVSRVSLEVLHLAASSNRQERQVLRAASLLDRHSSSSSSSNQGLAKQPNPLAGLCRDLDRRRVQHQLLEHQQRLVQHLGLLHLLVAPLPWGGMTAKLLPALGERYK